MPLKSSPGMDPENSPDRHTNFGLISLYQVLLRVGWIFKTESIIMPAVIDLIGGGGWLRGFLPMFNRLGQSIPPLFASSFVRRQQLKKRTLFVSAGVMGACFLFLSFVWATDSLRSSRWLPVIFLTAYAIFFSCVGINQLTLGTLTGKLIPVRRRGLLVLFATVLGSTIAISCAWFVLRRWIGEENGNFVRIFGFTGTAFVIAALLSLFLREPAVAATDPNRESPAQLLTGVGKALKEDGNFRRLCFAAGLFGMSITLFPHYQALARGHLDLPLTALVPWVIAQNAGAGFFSIPAGGFADRHGNRIVLRCCLLALCMAPVLAMLLARFSTDGQNSFWIVFVLVGLTPVTMRTFNNYTLEITDTDNHPRYLSTLNLCMAGPAIFTSILFGWSVDLFGYVPLFTAVASMVLLAWWISGRLDEPRKANEMRIPRDRRMNAMTGSFRFAQNAKSRTSGQW